ncbi:hypothetical protein B6U81_02015 [Thermoplasmatales archaeon ex4484_30]|nr:MAG: CTP-dependent riboflavin kinase [Thermoplasmata archaeon]OYT61890.1 MAG: hypothetical protein B6U81_02015 [Thermoplasmatales archaeon ex4484_30]
MKGIVISGKGEGRKFIMMNGYRKQIEEKFGFHPFPGTLNVKIEKESINDLKRIDAIMLDGFIKDDIVFGSVKCFPIKLSDTKGVLLLPEKSRYKDVAEIVAKENLRENLNLKDGDEICFNFLPFIKPGKKESFFALPHIGMKESSITIYYDSPFMNGRRDLCLDNAKNGYRKIIIKRDVASIIFDGNGKEEYENLMKWLREKNYSIVSPIRKVKYNHLSEWQIEIKIKHE